MLSSRDLLNAMLHHSPFDRVGIYDHGPWFETYQRWIKEGYPTQTAENGQQVPVNYAEHFRYDMFLAYGWFDQMPLRGCREVVAEDAESITTRSGAGATVRNWKHQSSTPEYVDFRMTSREIWEREYRPHLLRIDRERIAIAGAKKELERRRKQGFWTFFGHQFLWENMRCSMGNYVMLQSLLLDPEWIHDYNRVYTDFYKAHFKILIEEAGRPDGAYIYEDLGYRNGLMCSPKVLGELIFPYYRELVDFLHSYGLPVFLHTDGRIDQAIPLIIEAGFDGLNPLEIKVGCDPFLFAEQYGDKLVLSGGLDGRLLDCGDRALLKKEIVRLIEGMKARGGRFLFGVDHSIPPSVSYADFQYIVQVYRDHMTI